MFSTVDFIKRHKRKIAAGTIAAVGTCYGAKRLLESTEFSNFVRQPFSFFQNKEDQRRDECLDEERLNLMIELNQQACDKILCKIADQLKVQLDHSFDTDSLLTVLKTPELDSKRKIEIWGRLKILLVSKVFSSLTIFPLITIVLKAQRTILCQIACSELLQNATSMQQNSDASSIVYSGIKLLKSFFYDNIDCTEDNNCLETTNTTKINFNQNIQLIFCNSIHYLLTEGLIDLFKLIENCCIEIFEKINLDEKLNFMDFHFLMEQTIVKIKKLGEAKNFSNFVVPREKLNISSLNPIDRQKLESLFSQLLLALHSQQCRTLIDELINKYFDFVLKFLDDIFVEGKNIPFAKLIPKLCQIFGLITSTDKNSLFCSTLTFEEVKQFTQFIMNMGINIEH